ncbi:uncharacterized protein EbC_38400 [Erwinia billingiae Eb661]|uniref:Uncharacterized protein n=1 Tax=Erwinia billingiae (strain Eb661) TaxID=634500 RepID=D8MX14_ERWBE|nr:uncharacterized protein EbC_38400 [Erwinia billingiae Eb661]
MCHRKKEVGEGLFIIHRPACSYFVQRLHQRRLISAILGQ